MIRSPVCRHAVAATGDRIPFGAAICALEASPNSTRGIGAPALVTHGHASAMGKQTTIADVLIDNGTIFAFAFVFMFLLNKLLFDDWFALVSRPPPPEPRTSECEGY